MLILLAMLRRLPSWQRSGFFAGSTSHRSTIVTGRWKFNPPHSMHGVRKTARHVSIGRGDDTAIRKFGGRNRPPRSSKCFGVTSNFFHGNG